ncbi:MAG: SIS domain-containing protein [Deltaproteobacteria bacterium]|nr:SIS domain-containing protein [Deltaproteobacteria bacterium]
MDQRDFLEKYIDSLCTALRSLLLDDLLRVFQTLEEAHRERRRVFLAGNGGSAATASHMANDLMKGVAKRGGRGFRAIALSDNVPTITAIANDESYEEIFAGQLRELAQPDDVLIVFSGSGNSPNIVRAVEVAREMELNTIGFLGMRGGRVGGMVDIPVVVPSNDYGIIEDVHLMFDHLVTAYFERCQAPEKEMQKRPGRVL